MVKLAIIYYSNTGTNYKLSQWAEEGAKEAGAEVRLLKLPRINGETADSSDPIKKAHAEATKDVAEVTLDDLVWADAIIFSTPARYGQMVAPLKAFLEQTGGLWFEGKLVNKVVSAMASAQNPHGGQEGVILSLYASMYHWGAIVAAPGYTDPIIFAAGGNPYGTSVTVGASGEILDDEEAIRAAAKHQAKRTVAVAEWVTKGNK